MKKSLFAAFFAGALFFGQLTMPFQAHATTWTSTNDGTGSGLDADLIDGLNSSIFLRNDMSGALTGSLTVSSNLAVNGGSITSTSPITIDGNGTLTLNDNISQAGATTFSTGTGAVSLNGNVTLGSGKSFTQSGASTLTTGTGTTSIGGAATIAGTLGVTGATTHTGSTTMNGALVVTNVSGATFGPYGTAAGSTTESRYAELAANGTNYVGFKAPDSLAANVIWKLPSVDGTASQVLTTNGSGTLAWATMVSSSNALSGLTAATTTNTIESLTNAQTWNWSTATTQNPLTLSAASLTSGSLLTLNSLVGSNALNVASGNITQSGAGSFTTGTGSVSLNGNVTLGSGKNFTQSGASTLATGTGTTSIGGAATVAGTLTVTGASTLTGSFASNGNTTVGDASTDRLTVNAQIIGASPLKFQGATDDANSTILAFAEPTGTNTISFPNKSGTVAMTSDIPASSSPSLSGLTAATSTNSIDNTLNVQTWSWSTATTQTPLSLSANALTSGSLLNLSSLAGSNALNITAGNQALAGNFSQSGATTFSTGTGSVSLNGSVTLASGKNFTQSGASTLTTGTGTTTVSGNLASNGNTTIGDANTDRTTVNAQILGTSPLYFQGGTDDAYTTNFAITNPTANRTITFKDASGTVAFTSDIPSSSGTALTDNMVDAYDLQEGANNYININTTNGAENISLGSAAVNQSFNFLGSGALSLGSGAVTGGGSIALGAGATATGSSSVGLGYSSHATGGYAVALGGGTASGSSALAAGPSTASAQYSSAIGYSLNAQSYDESVFGQYNILNSSLNPTSWVTTDPLFVVGNGTSSSGTSNALTILKNGYVGIDTANPTVALYISGDYAITGDKSAVVYTDTQGPTRVYTEESTGVYFTDYGSGQLVNGQVEIPIDSTLLQTITIDANHPLLVFVQMTSPGSVYTKSGSKSFSVFANAGTPSDATFSYRIVAKRKFYEDTHLTPMKATVDKYMRPDLTEEERTSLNARWNQ